MLQIIFLSSHQFLPGPINSIQVGSHHLFNLHQWRCIRIIYKSRSYMGFPMWAKHITNLLEYNVRDRVRLVRSYKVALKCNSTQACLIIFFFQNADIVGHTQAPRAPLFHLYSSYPVAIAIGTAAAPPWPWLYELLHFPRPELFSFFIISPHYPWNVTTLIWGGSSFYFFAAFYCSHPGFNVRLL